MSRMSSQNRWVPGIISILKPEISDISTPCYSHSQGNGETIVQQAFVSTALCGSSQQKQDSKNVFYFDLCNSMAQSNIAWNKLEQPAFRKFFEKYCNRHIPNESTLRKNYLKKCYQNHRKGD
ncbi:unnamed protein product [Acanthoscelides obtectus]|uniref:Uncharacterized protein n=1 Tax=Acanthoscelides obtectus TaxID=200917 RepID=A0A9P0PW03_ACAOB|nr:unnamed protein product [Acanthoscelides obtectus]CAK1620291.1 hypothetical protein AOBTE_LOCUS285 [Acanthoscelides obtectus]